MDQGRARFTGDNFYSNDLFSFNVKTKKWTELKSDTSNQSIFLSILSTDTQSDFQHRFSPCGRRSHSAFAYNTKMIIFGGYQESVHLHFNDLHEYDTIRNEWRILDQNGVKPCPRRRNGANLINNRLIIFGGTGPIEQSHDISSTTAAAIASANQSNSPELIQYDQLLLRLQRNLAYVQNAARERNILDFEELNNTLRNARARILQPLQQLLNEPFLENNLNNQNELAVAHMNEENDHIEPENLENEDEHNELVPIDEFEDDESGSDGLINDEGDSENDEDDLNVDDDFNQGLVSLSDLHVLELDGDIKQILPRFKE